MMPWTQQGMDASTDWFRSQAGVPPGPGPDQNPGGPPNPPLPPEGQQAGSAAAGSPPPAAPSQGANPLQNPLDLIHMFGFSGGGAVFDSGGIMPPKSVGLNLSNHPEHVLTGSQMNRIRDNAKQPAAAGAGLTIAGDVIVQDYEDFEREMTKRSRWGSAQYRGRP
jgi:hypothetical protein